jgi:2-polyprenyl-3-methyl-5-hydroxy-6-metoxy-1,4-benzoquinol methylase
MIIFPTKKTIDKKNIHCYNNIANEYEDDAHATCRDFEYFTNVFLNYFFTSYKIEDNVRYLDIGIGTGKSLETRMDNNNTLIDFLIKKRCIIDVLDISEEMIKVTKNKFHEKINNYIQKSIFDFRPEQKYNIIVATLCDPYLTKEFIKIANSILEINGYLILIYPSLSWARQIRGNSCSAKITFNSRNGKKYHSYSFCWDGNNLWRYLEKIGFHNKSLTKYYLKELEKNKSELNNKILLADVNARFCTAIISKK